MKFCLRTTESCMVQTSVHQNRFDTACTFFPAGSQPLDGGSRGNAAWLGYRCVESDQLAGHAGEETKRSGQWLLRRASQGWIMDLRTPFIQADASRALPSYYLFKNIFEE